MLKPPAKRSSGSEKDAENEKETTTDPPEFPATDESVVLVTTKQTATQQIATIGRASKTHLTPQQLTALNLIEDTLDLLFKEPWSVFLLERKENLQREKLRQRWSRIEKGQAEDALKLVRKEPAASRPVLAATIKKHTAPLQKRLKATEAQVTKLSSTVLDTSQDETNARIEAKQKRKRDKRLRAKERKRQKKAAAEAEANDDDSSDESREANEANNEDEDSDSVDEDDISSTHPKEARGSPVENNKSPKKKKNLKTHTLNNQNSPAIAKDAEEENNGTKRKKKRKERQQKRQSYSWKRDGKKTE